MALPRIACILGAAVCAVSAQYSIQHQILADPSAIEAQKQIYLAQIQADLEEQTKALQRAAAEQRARLASQQVQLKVEYNQQKAQAEHLMAKQKLEEEFAKTSLELQKQRVEAQNVLQQELARIAREAIA